MIPGSGGGGGGWVMCWLEAGPHSIGLPHDLSYLDRPKYEGQYGSQLSHDTLQCNTI